MSPLLKVLILDDGVYLLRRDGTLTPLVPGGHGARPVGWNVDPVTTRRSRPA